MWVARNENGQAVLFNTKPCRSNIDPNLTDGFWVIFDSGDVTVDICRGDAIVETIFWGITVSECMLEAMSRDDSVEFPLMQLTWEGEPVEIDNF